MKPKNIDDVIAHLGDRVYVDALYGPAMDAVADCIRAMIVAEPGQNLVAMDFSAIEARVLAWLSGDEAVLDIFRGDGKIYEHAAADIYRVPMDEVTDAQRQIGKVAVLALGYGGGVGAFQSMAKNYNVNVGDEKADEIKSAWRSAHRPVVEYWYALEEAALSALKSGQVTFAGAFGRHVSFKKSGSFLWCKLPSGRVLCYPYPETRTIETPWGSEKEAVTYMTVIADKKSKILPDASSRAAWQRISTYGGSLCENVTQAVARDLLAEAMLRFSQHGAKIVMHVHDEIVIETPAGEDWLERARELMSVVPSWAAGLPVSAEGWQAKRYRK